MAELLKNENFVWFVMSLIVLGVSQLLKLPIKLLTKKFIKKDNIRSRVNICIMLIPLALGILCDWLYCSLYLHIAFSVIEGLKIGGTAVTLYGVIEKAFKGKQSTETTETLKLVENITKDGKVDKRDTQAIKDFAEKLNSVK